MNCDQAREQIHAVLDGAAGAEEERLLRAHLESCAECRTEFDDTSALTELLREIPRPRAPEGFADRVRAELPRSRRGRLLRFAAPVAAAAALLLAAFLAGPWIAKRAAPQPVTVAGSRDAPDQGIPAGNRPATEAMDGDHERGGEKRRVAGGGDSRRSAYSGDLGGAGEGVAGSGAAPPGRPAGAPREPSMPKSDLAYSREYLASGKAPDAAAGLILAEMGNHRSRSSSPRSKLAPELLEKLETDELGSPAKMMLVLTAEEADYLEGDLARLAGIVLDRRNGEDGPQAEDESEAVEEFAAKAKDLRVAITFQPK